MLHCEARKYFQRLDVVNSPAVTIKLVEDLECLSLLLNGRCRNGLEVFEMAKKSKGLAAYEAVNDVKLVTADEAALIAGVSRRGWYRFFSKGLAPKPVHIGRCARWKIVELFKWIDEDCHSMTSDNGGKS